MDNSELIVISHCKNCNNDVEHHNFCPNCGAKKITKRITFKSVVSEISEVHLNLDNSIFRTIKDLTIKPYIVIDGYINGVRKKYLNLISYLLISITLTATLSYIKEFFFNIQPEIEKLNDSHKYIRLVEDTIDKFPTLGYFILIPIYSLFSLYMFRKYKKYNFTEHIVINTYLTAHITILSFIPSFIDFSFGEHVKYLNIIFKLIPFIYAAFLFKNLYHITYKKTVFRMVDGFLLLLAIAAIFATIKILAK